MYVFQEGIDLYGFLISENELKMDPEKAAAIVSWPSPNRLFEVLSFHGLASFYRKFIRDFSSICVPMVETVKNANQPFHLTDSAERSFQLLRKKITE